MCEQVNKDREKRHEVDGRENKRVARVVVSDILVALVDVAGLYDWISLLLLVCPWIEMMNVIEREWFGWRKKKWVHFVSWHVSIVSWKWSFLVEKRKETVWWLIIDVRFPTSFSTFTLSQALHIDERTEKEAGESVETIAFWDASMKCMRWNECQ